MAAEIANQRACEQVIACRPRLLGVSPAIEVVPGMRPEMILHAAPPTERDALVGIDLLRVLATGIRPVIDIVILHREPGAGMIGFGLVSPPMACFEQAGRAFRSATKN